MITYNNIINRFAAFVNAHSFLETFTHGSPSGVDLDKFEAYPCMHVVYTGAKYESTSKEYSFEVYILDLPPDKADKVDNQTQLISNAEQAAEDILADMRNGDNIFDFGHHYSVTNAMTSPLEHAASNSLSGILLTISIEVGFTLDSCNAPLKGVTSGGSTIPSGAGAVISTINYNTASVTTVIAGANVVKTPLTLPADAAIDLRKSLSYNLDGTLNRNGLSGLNTTATIDVEYRLKATALAAGVMEFTDQSSGVNFNLSETHTFAAAGEVELVINETAVVTASGSMVTGLRVLSTIGGTVILQGVSFTINNKF